MVMLASDPDLVANDLGPLAWVMDELRKSLDTASIALRRFVRDAAAPGAAPDTGPLRMARQQLHQAVGALEMVGLAAPAQVLRAMEQAVQAFADRPALCTEAAVSKVERAGFALAEYLDGVLLGKPHSPVALFPQYRDVLALCGADRVHPADLWSHEWRWHQPQPASSSRIGDLGYAPVVRSRMDQAVLRIVKSAEPQAAAELAELCAGLAAGLAVDPQQRQARSFWSVAAGFFEALGGGSLPCDLYVKRAASRVLLQYAQLARGEATVSERLALDLAFFCAQALPFAPGTAPHLEAVRAAWALHRHVPVDYEQEQFGRFDPALLNQARKRLAAAREGWSALAGGDTSKLRSTGDVFAGLREVLTRLHPPLAPLADALGAVADAAVVLAQAPSAELAMEAATAILFLEAMLEDFDPTDAQWPVRGGELARRLDRVQEGLAPEPLAPWMEELYRRVSDRQSMGSVVGELRSTLAGLEKELDSFFRQPQDRSPLQTVPGQLTQMRGVFSVLGLDHAAQTVLRMRDGVQALVSAPAGDTLPGSEALGNNLGALGLLVDMLGYQPALARKLFVFDEATGELQPVMGRASPPAQADEPVDVTDGFADTVGALGDDGEIADEAAAATAEAFSASDLSDLSDLSDARGASDAIEVTELSEMPDDAAWPRIETEGLAQVEAVAADPPIDAPVPTWEPERAVAASAESMLDEQAELQSIFLDEAFEVVQSGRDALARLAAEPADLTALTTLRRAFHTLKGSARMVGLEAYGEAAWALEQVLNAWLADQRPADEVLIAFARSALEGLARWRDEIAAGAVASEWNAELFSGPAEAFRAGRAQVGFVFPGDAPPVAQPLEAVPAEPFKCIGPLRIAVPLFNVFLHEADEWSRRLQQALADWAIAPGLPVTDALIALAHSLAGSSSTVGFQALSGLARRLEDSLGRAQSLAWTTREHAVAWTDAADEISRLLHQFAAGFFKEPAEPVLLALQALDDLEIPARPQLAQAPVDLPLVVPDPQVSWTDAPDRDLFPIFEEEALELLPRLGEALRQWHAGGTAAAARDEVLRALHTLKGSARLAGALGLGELAHAMESQVEALADAVTPAQIEPLLHGFDLMQAAFDALRAPSAATPSDTEALLLGEMADGVYPGMDLGAEAGEPSAVAALEGPAVRTARSEDMPEVSEVPDVPELQALPTLPQAPPEAPAEPAALPPPIGAGPAAPRAPGPTVRVRAQLLDRLVNQAGEVMITRSRLEAQWRQARHSLDDLTTNLERLRSQLRDVELQAETQMQSRLAQSRDVAAGFDPLEFDRFTRVQELTRMMAESVNDIATVQRSLQRTVQATEDDLAAQARQARELQRDLLRTRMVAFDAIADRLHRTVRQAARETGKQVRLEIRGGTIEIDRGVLERMTPAFEHLLRNAVVHGVEAAEARASAGKEAAGQVVIALAHEGNDVSVSFQDDGAGLDVARIRDKAVALGLLRADQPLADAQAADLIFAPGFSTAGEVTELAGRGIGMDVVRAEVNALGGRIETTTVRGRGARFHLVLPLTTAVTQVVMVRCGALSFGVPAHLVEIIHRTLPAPLRQAQEEERFLHAGEPVPFFWGGALLRDSAASAEPVGRSTPVIVLRSAAQRVALHVDEVLGHQEVVVKHLGPQLARLPGLAGMTVLPSGAVVLIYNPVALAVVYGDAARALSAAGQGTAATGAAGSPVAPLPPLVLVVDDSITVRRVTQRLLQREGLRVVLANDGLQALERLEHERPALVLSDIEMPRMDGFDLVRNLRADARWAGLPVVMITSRIAQKHRDHAAALGVDHYLGKPYAEDELLRLVRHYTAAAPATSA